MIVDKNGQIVCVICCPEEDIPAAMVQVGGVRYVPSNGYRGDNLYLNGEEFVIRVPAPSAAHTFNWVTKVWEDLRNLQDMKALKWTEIKQARNKAEYAGFAWEGNVFDSDAMSQQRITSAVTLAMMSTEFTIYWTLKNNETVYLNRTQMAEVGNELGFHVAQVFRTAQNRRITLDSLTTVEEINALVW